MIWGTASTGCCNMGWRYNPCKNDLLPDLRVKSSPAMTILSPVAFLFLQWSQHKWIMILYLSPCKSIHGSSGNSLDSAGKMPAERLAKPWFCRMIYSLWTVFFQQWDHVVFFVFFKCLCSHNAVSSSSRWLCTAAILWNPTVRLQNKHWKY